MGPDSEYDGDTFRFLLGEPPEGQEADAAQEALQERFFTDEASGTYTHHFDTGVEIELTSDFDVHVAWVWDRVQNPQPLEDGSFPRQDDTRLVFGLGWSF